MSTLEVKAESDSPRPTSTPPVFNPKVMSVPSRAPPRSCFQTIVAVEVETRKKAFFIHKDLLVFHSDYFRGAFNESFIEATEGKISLVDERVEVFSIVNQFIYTRELSDNVDSDLDWELLVRTWLFGDKHLMPALQNRVISILMEKYENTDIVTTCLLKLVYKNTLPSSPLRRIMVDLAGYALDIVSIMDLGEGKRWPHEALVDLVKILGTRIEEYRDEPELPEENKCTCYYHIHAAGEDCGTEL